VDSAIDASHGPPDSRVKILTRRPEREGGRYGFQRYALPTNENRARHGDGTAIAKPAMSEVRPRRSRRGGGTNRQLEPVVRLRSLRDALHRAAIAHHQTSVGPRPAAPAVSQKDDFV